eukprot:1313912-Alexandrium_andersonii.AAC.1
MTRTFLHVSPDRSTQHMWPMERSARRACTACGHVQIVGVRGVRRAACPIDTARQAGRARHGAAHSDELNDIELAG